MPRQRGNGAACRGKRSAQHSGPGSPEELAACLTRGGDGLIAMDRGGAKSWYLYDGHGSVRMLANGTGQTTDTWTYDAWGETTSRTGVTENDYLYAGERFDQTTELYQLRARYLDPKTGTFLSLDPYQGNRHDPASLHKYMYANANPVNNVDPTGMWTLGELGGAMAGQGILAGANGLNFWTVLGALKGAAHSVQFACSMRSLILEVEDLHSYFVADGVLVHNYKDDIKEFRAIAKQKGVDLDAFLDAVYTYKYRFSLPKGASLSKKKPGELAGDVKNGQWF